MALGEKEKRLAESIGNREHKTALSKVVVGEVMVEVEFMGRKMELTMGIEMIVKKRLKKRK